MRKKMNWLLPGLVWLALFAAAPDLRADSGESVVVIYNNLMPESKNVAEHYAQRRHVPTNHLIGFSLPATEAMTRTEFSDRLQKPLLRKLEEKELFTFITETNSQATHARRKLSDAKIRYAVLCYGVPLKILKEPDLVEEGVDKLRPELRRNEAAVDSELAWLPSLPQKPMLAGPMANPFYGATNSALMQPTSGILLVARLDGPTPDIALSLVDKALEAETNGLWGRAYFDARGITNGAYLQGDEWVRGASEVCRRLGFETLLDDKPETLPASFPMSQIALYAGWYDENVSGPFTRPKVEFMPGAVAYHLHSFSASTIRSATRHWVGPLLEKGATATMGSVEEPYLIGTPDLTAFFSRLIYFGFSFGEAAYAAQNSLSWQTTVVGDPLYRPFARKPQRQHEDLARRELKLIEWSHLRVVDLNLASGYPADDVINYLERLPLTRQSALLKEKLADVYLAGRKLSLAMSEYEAALGLNPTPQQKIRLILTLTRVQTLYGRDKQAYGWYQKFLKEFPDYPDLLAIYQKILPLAETVGAKEDVEKYQQEIKKLSPPAQSGKP
jgi:uncharacterized protein (TIGR03790 family)